MTHAEGDDSLVPGRLTLRNAGCSLAASLPCNQSAPPVHRQALARGRPASVDCQPCISAQQPCGCQAVELLQHVVAEKKRPSVMCNCKVHAAAALGWVPPASLQTVS